MSDSINPIYRADNLKATYEYSGKCAQDLGRIIKNNNLLSSDINAIKHILSFFNLKLNKFQKGEYKHYIFNLKNSIVYKFYNYHICTKNRVTDKTAYIASDMSIYNNPWYYFNPADIYSQPK